MTDNSLTELLLDAPIIAAVKSEDGLPKAIASNSAVIFLLCGTVCNIGSLTEQVRAHGKQVFVHLDLVDGLASRDIAADFIRQNTPANGIISTRQNLIRRGRELGLTTIQRYFVHDSRALENILRQSCEADLLDILPGTIPKTLRRIAQSARQPLIASGLLSDKEDIMSALAAGALAVSATTPELWFL